MKKNSFLLLIISVLSSCAMQIDRGNYTIKGTVVGSNNEKVYFSVFDDAQNKWKLVDTTNIKGGSFSFTGEADGRQLCEVKIEHSQPIKFFLENSNIQLNGEITKLKDVVVRGSQANDEFLTLQDSISALLHKQNMLYIKAKSAENDGYTEIAKISFSNFQNSQKNVYLFLKRYCENNRDSAPLRYVIRANKKSLTEKEYNNLMKKF